MYNGVFNFNFLALLLSEILGVSQIYTRGPYAPQRRTLFTQSEYFTISNCVFNFNILALVVSKLSGGPKFTLGGSVPPCTPPRGKNFVPEASTLLCLMAFSISTFQLFYFLRYQGVPNLHQGPRGPNWKSAQEVNSHLVCDPTIRQPGFDLPWQQWSLLKPFSHGTVILRCLQKEMATYILCPCGKIQTMSHIVKSCPDKTEWRLISSTLCG